MISNREIEPFTDIGKSFTNIGNSDIFTDISNLFTDICIWLDLPISANDLPISVTGFDKGKWLDLSISILPKLYIYGAN